MTDHPKTLLQIAGAPQHPAPLSDAVLVLIDHQREYTDGGLPLVGIDAAADELRRLLALARAKAVPVSMWFTTAVPAAPCSPPRRLTRRSSPA